MAGSVAGSLIVLACLFATHSDEPLWYDSRLFLVGIPSVIVTKNLVPGAPFRASTLLVCGAVFTWVFVLGWPATMLFEISYADILLLSPYAFCSAVALAYLVNRTMEA